MGAVGGLQGVGIARKREVRRAICLEGCLVVPLLGTEEGSQVGIVVQVEVGIDEAIAVDIAAVDVAAVGIADILESWAG